MTGAAAWAAWATMLTAMPGDARAQTAAAPVAPPIQLLPTPSPAPSPSPAPPARLKGLEDFSLPSDRPTLAPPATPTPTPSQVRPLVAQPSPRATSTPRPTQPPSPGPTPAPRPSAGSEPSLSASPAPFPVSTPAPLPTPRAAPPMVATPVRPSPAPGRPVAPPPAAGGWSDWEGLGVALALLAATASILWSRRRRSSVEPPATIEPAATASATPRIAASPLRPAPVVVPRARIEIELLPRRGGLTLISLVFEGELIVRNTGDLPAERVAVEASLIPARSAQDAELAALFARPITRPATPSFALAPGEERRVRLVAALPLAGVEPLVAGGRAMIVPVLAANVVYASGNAEGQTAAAWIVGIARTGSDKLAPFWIDAAGLVDTLAARPHALAVAR